MLMWNPLVWRGEATCLLTVQCPHCLDICPLSLGHSSRVKYAQTAPQATWPNILENISTKILLHFFPLSYNFIVSQAGSGIMVTTVLTWREGGREGREGVSANFFIRDVGSHSDYNKNKPCNKTHKMLRQLLWFLMMNRWAERWEVQNGGVCCWHLETPGDEAGCWQCLKDGDEWSPVPSSELDNNPGSEAVRTTVSPGPIALSKL